MNLWARPTATVLALAVFAGALTVGCGVNELPDYMPRVQTMGPTFHIPNGPRVYMGSSYDHGPVSIGVDIITFQTGIDLRRKLTAAVSPDDLSQALSDSLRGALTQQFPDVEFVDRTDDVSAVLNVKISEYGAYSNAPEDGVYIDFDVDAWIIYPAEDDKLIWTYHEHYFYEVTDYWFWHSPITAIANLSQVADLSESELRQILMDTAEQAGRDLAAQMRLDTNKG